MYYPGMERGVFLARPNRFIAHIELESGVQVCHVKNTGRCKELLTPGAEVWVQKAANPARKTAYDLIAVRKGERMINMDANAPNKVFAEWAQAGRFLPDLSLLLPETTHGDSRFDFYVEAPNLRGFVEVKGVTLEEDGVVRFPDAPTERGVKHLHGLKRCVGEGYEAWAVFIIQMAGVRWLEPNRKTHPEFADALRESAGSGVHLLALSCQVEPDRLTVDQPVEVRLC
ncbi:MAG: DNA/RNA nuclease SfsA [Eubacteriales bacterium]|nr:DNA/RNA nuclease SfsA [Eubacteriales bacterium]